MRLFISDQQQSRPYVAPFSHNTSVTDRWTTDRLQTTTTTTTRPIRSAKNLVKTPRIMQMFTETRVNGVPLLSSNSQIPGRHPRNMSALGRHSFYFFENCRIHKAKKTICTCLMSAVDIYFFFFFFFSSLQYPAVDISINCMQCRLQLYILVLSRIFASQM